MSAHSSSILVTTRGSDLEPRASVAAPAPLTALQSSGSGLWNWHFFLENMYSWAKYKERHKPKWREGMPLPLPPSTPPLTFSVRVGQTFSLLFLSFLIYQEGLLPRALRIKRNCRGGGCVERTEPGSGELLCPCADLL